MKFLITASLAVYASAAFTPDARLSVSSRISTTAATPRKFASIQEASSRPSTTSTTSTSTSNMSPLRMTFFDNLPDLPDLPNPFSNKNDSDDGAAVQPRPPNVPPPISNEPDALFARAKAIVASDLGLRDPSILAEDFEWVGPNVVSTGTLNREEYLAAGQFFNLRKAFPDLDYRAHDFRLDPKDPNTVRLTARTVGTMRGELRLRSETIPPNGNRMVCPPEAISMTFDPKSGKMVKLCSGFCMDRLVGNTGGLCGVMAAATVAGSPPSEWELYPPSVVVSRFFKRSVAQLKEPDQFFLAPFPESVMIQLAKGVLAADTGTKDPDLLSNDFSYCGPYVGPLNKDAFIDEFTSFELRLAYPDLDENYSNFRVDPYDPYRVWYDVKATGTRTGVFNGKEPDGGSYVGAPECASMTFDDDGFCTRMTGGAVMDPTDGNTGGLGGISGILYASGVAESPIDARPLPQIISRIQKGLLGSITGESVDDFASAGVKEIKKIPPPPPPLPPVPPKPVETKTVAITPPPPPVVSTPSPPEPPKVVAPPPPPEKPATITPPSNPLANISIPNPLASSATQSIETKKEEVKKPPIPRSPKPTISEDPADPVSDAFSSFFGTKSSTAPEPVKKDTSAAANKAKEAQQKAAQQKAAKEKAAQQKAAQQQAAKEKAAQQKAAQQQAAEEKRKNALAAAEAKRREAEAKREQALAAADEKRKQAEEKRNAMLKAKQAEKVLEKAKPSATISLGFFGFGQKTETEDSADVKAQPPKPTASAPRGVPTLRNWRQNRDGSLTGLIYNSRVFGAGESITTSQIQGKPLESAVVTTKSGSKYFLEKKSPVGGGRAVKPKAKPAAQTAAAAAKKKAQAAEAAKAKAEAAKQARLDAAAKKKEQQEAAQRAKAEAAAKRKEQQEAAQQARAEAAAAKKAQQEAAQQARADAAAAKAEAAAAKKAQQEAAQQARADAAAAKKAQQEAAQQARAEAAAAKKEQQEAAKRAKAEAAAAKAEAAAKRKEEQQAAQRAKAEAAAAKKEQQEAAQRAKAEAAAKRKEEQEAAKRAKAEAAEQRKLEAAAKKKEAAMKNAQKKQPPRQRTPGTIALGATPESTSPGFFSFGKNEKKPPSGVPVLNRWKKNGDGSVTGFVSGSKNFKEGEKVTTSPLAPNQTVGAGQVVSTKSGSKYFLK